MSRSKKPRKLQDLDTEQQQNVMTRISNLFQEIKKENYELREENLGKEEVINNYFNEIKDLQNQRRAFQEKLKNGKDSNSRHLTQLFSIVKDDGIGTEYRENLKKKRESYVQKRLDMIREN